MLRSCGSGFIFSILGSLLVGSRPAGALASSFLLPGRALPGASGSLHHAGQPGAGENVLGRRRAPARGQPVVDRFLGRFGRLLRYSAAWWRRTSAGAGSSSLRVVAALLGMRDDARHAGEQGDGQQRPNVRPPGVLTFMVAMVALQIFVTQGNKLGWTSPLILWPDRRSAWCSASVLPRRIRAISNAFVDFKLFRNSTYTGATLSNFLLNGVGRHADRVAAAGAARRQHDGAASGLLTLGYAIAIIAFIRVGEKLLQRFGPRKPMIWGCLHHGLSILLLMPANLMLADYKVLAISRLYAVRRRAGFYATPSTDAALVEPAGGQAGSGAGIYKMASSLGAAFGVAISAAIFTALSANNAR